LPLTGVGVVDMIITEMGVIDVTPEGLLLREIAAGFSIEDVQKVTVPTLRSASDLRIMSQ
jgi:acyl CoA:acetate/3-ketoacid CoA transferase beta subunit